MTKEEHDKLKDSGMMFEFLLNFMGNYFEDLELCAMHRGKGIEPGKVYALTMRELAIELDAQVSLRFVVESDGGTRFVNTGTLDPALRLLAVALREGVIESVAGSIAEEMEERGWKIEPVKG